MSKKLTRTIAWVIISILVLQSSVNFSFAENINNNFKSFNEYEETHEQINFDLLAITITNKENLIVDVDPEVSILKKAKAVQEKAKYDAYIQEHPDAADNLLSTLNNGEYLCAVSYTDAPLTWAGDHFERVKKASGTHNSLLMRASAASTSATSDASTRYRLTLQTQITRAGTSSPYTYYAKTYGSWNNLLSVPLLGGKKTPGSGLDYVLQACPTVTSSSTFSSKYNYKTNGSKNGQEGINFFRTDGGDSWVKYEVVDDPSGLAQLKEFACTQTFYAKSTSKTKKINSYYVHTWKSLSISVTVSGSAGKSGGNPSASVGLSITPSVTEKNWQLYNFVSFNW